MTENNKIRLRHLIERILGQHYAALSEEQVNCLILQSGFVLSSQGQFNSNMFVMLIVPSILPNENLAMRLFEALSNNPPLQEVAANDDQSGSASSLTSSLQDHHYHEGGEDATDEATEESLEPVAEVLGREVAPQVMEEQMDEEFSELQGGSLTYSTPTSGTDTTNPQQ
jgi:hypothetical protein